MSEVIVEVGDRHIREINEEIQDLCRKNKKIRIINTLSRHNLGIGLPPNCELSFEGSVGYFCGGLNTGAKLSIERNAGWACGEGMSDGMITVGGYAGMSVGELHSFSKTQAAITLKLKSLDNSCGTEHRDFSENNRSSFGQHSIMVHLPWSMVNSYSLSLIFRRPCLRAAKCRIFKTLATPESD